MATLTGRAGPRLRPRILTAQDVGTPQAVVVRGRRGHLRYAPVVVDAADVAAVTAAPASAAANPAVAAPRPVRAGVATAFGRLEARA